MRERSTTAEAGWRVDRRTFLRAMGLGAIGVVAGGALAARLAPLVVPAAAQTSPIDDLALQLQFDPERIFRFVADQIRYQPYAGVLRGAEGARLARAANSADQAALLAALLRASGVPVRFVEGELDATHVERIAAGSLLDAETIRQRTLEALVEALPDGSLPSTPAPDAETEQRISQALASGEHVLTWARDQVLDTVELLESALASAGIPIPDQAAGLPELERHRHIWLQMASGPTWIDLDPSIAGAAAGEVIAIAATTMEALPDDLRHRIDFRVIGESIAAGDLVQETLLEAAHYADGLVGVPVGLLNVEREGLKAVGAIITSALGGGTTYLPCLVAGEDVVVGPGAIRFGGGGAPIDDVFAALPSGDPSHPLDGEPTAEWLEITITSPGTDPVTARRAVFDRIGPAARLDGSSFAGLTPAELTAIDPGHPPDFMPAQTSHWLSVESAIVPASRIVRLAADSRDPGRIATPVQMFHVAQAAGSAALSDDLGGHWFLDGPNIVSLTVTQELIDDHVMLRPVLDIWHRSHGRTPITAGPARGSSLVGGVLAHVSERIAAGNADSAADPASRGPSVGAVFEAARDAGISMRTLTDTAEVAGLPLPKDTMARLVEALAAGHVVVLPERPVAIGGLDRTGWWRVDPMTGWAVDEMDDGRGSDAAQRSALAYTLTEASPSYYRLGYCVGLVFLVAATWGLFVSGVAVAATSSGGALAGLGAISAASGAVGTGATLPALLGAC